MLPKAIAQEARGNPNGIAGFVPVLTIQQGEEVVRPARSQVLLGIVAPLEAGNCRLIYVLATTGLANRRLGC